MFKDDEAKGLFEMGLEALQTIHGCSGWVPTLKKPIESVEAILTIHGCSGCPNFREQLFVVCLGKEKKERRKENRNMDRPWLQGLSQLLRTFFVVYVGKRKERKEQYGCGITYIRKCELKAYWNQSTSQLGYPIIIISHIVWELEPLVLREGCSECGSSGQVELLLCKGDCFSFLFVSSPLMEIMVLCCVSFIFTSCEDLKLDFFFLLIFFN